MRTSTALTLTPDALEDMSFRTGVPIELGERHAYLTVAGVKYRAELPEGDAA